MTERRTNKTTKKQSMTKRPATYRASNGRPGKRRQRPAAGGSVGSGSVIAVVAVTGVMAALSVWSGACSGDKHGDSVPKPSVSTTSSVRSVESSPVRLVPPAKPVVSARVDAGTDAQNVQDASADAAEGPWEGAWIGATVQTAPIYAVMSRSRKAMIGNMRFGEKAPGYAEAIRKSNCKQGWYRLHPYGYVCGRHATANLESSRFRSAPKPPDLEAIVPYRYAYNRKNGTPLYRVIPTREQMREYEPYLKKRSKNKRKHKVSKHGESTLRVAKAYPVAQASASASANASARLLPLLPVRGDDAGVAIVDGGVLAVIDGGEDAAAKVPWWVQAEDGGKPEITLQDMEEDSDHILAKRMAKGFFIAVSRSFRRNGRYWYKTTEGLFAPADRMSINAPPKFHGVELGGADDPKLPIAFVVRAKTPKYQLGEDGKKLRRHGRLKRLSMIELTGKSMRRGSRLYRETRDGYWVRSRHLGLVDPGPPPSGVGAHERWIDVNLTQQTLVAFEGSEPVYATLISSGKKGHTKKTDHRTIQGTFRVREKHVTATMDGDGAVPSEGPYSIQDVPYVMYFKRSYAIHGAFWHNNFGHRMSHGCVNLAPLDAKHLFFWADPQIPQGWHGVWSDNEHPGSRIVVHE